MAPIGTITTSLKLNKHFVQGSRDPITGIITITYKPKAANNELFGPLNLRVVLEGQMKIHVSENRTSHAYIFFDEDRLLFRKVEDVLNRPLRIFAGKVETVPFKMCFPDQRSPPSFQTRFQAQAERQYGKHQGAARVEYTLRTEADLPGIDVEVVNSVEIRVLYEQPSSILVANGALGGQEISQMLKVESHQLLPEEERPSGLISKTKATLNKIPKPVISFKATCSRVPDVVTVGQSIQFEVRIQVDTKSTTASTIPDISLSEAKINIIARTELYATNSKGVNSPRLEDSDVLHSLRMTDQDPAEPFAKSYDNTKTLRFAALPEGTPSSFSTMKLSRSYRAQVELHFVVGAAQMAVMKKQIGLRILPPSSSLAPPEYARNTSEANNAGPSRALDGNAGEVLPLYEDAVGQNH